MTNLTVDKTITIDMFMDDWVEERISELYKDQEFMRLLKEPDKKRFWEYVDKEPYDVKKVIPPIFDEYTPYGIFYGLESLPVELEVCYAILAFHVPSTFKRLCGGDLVDLMALQEVTVPDDNPYFSSKDGVLYNKDLTQLIFCPNNRKKTSLIIPSSVTEMDPAAFLQNMSLKSVVLSENLEKMDPYAFSQCYSLESITVPSLNPYFSSYEGVLFDKRMERLIQYPVKKSDKSFITPEKTRFINDGAFQSNRSLEEITLNDGLREIGSSAFMDCRNLRSINLPDTVTDIGMNAFAGDSNLSSIILPPKIKYLCSSLFSGCSSLREIIIPDGVERIDEYPFMGCSALKRVTIPNSVVIIHGSAFDDCYALRSLEYGGTKAQFWGICVLEVPLFECSDVKCIHCSDGDILLDRDC